MALLCPAKMVTVAGTVAAFVLEEERFTTVSEPRALAMLTVAVKLPETSLTEVDARANDREPRGLIVNAFEVPCLPLTLSCAVSEMLPTSSTVTFPVQTPALNEPLWAGCMGTVS